jgi:hypothetical protein
MILGIRALGGGLLILKTKTPKPMGAYALCRDTPDNSYDPLFCRSMLRRYDGASCDATMGRAATLRWGELRRYEGASYEGTTSLLLDFNPETIARIR